MLIKALVDYAATAPGLKSQLEDRSVISTDVDWLVSIDTDGRFIGLVPTAGREVKRGRKTVVQPKVYLIPREGYRGAGTYPRLAVDEGKYVFGWIAPEDAADPKALEQHRAFQKLVHMAAVETGDPGLTACDRFFQQPAQLERVRSELAKRPRALQDRYAFALSDDADRPVFERPAARTWWRDNGPVKFDPNLPDPAREGSYKSAPLGSGDSCSQGAICLGCGEVRPCVATCDKIRGIPNTAMGRGSLMSFDKEAFRSYGWEQNANSPTCQECASSFTVGLEHLLDRDNSPRTRIDQAGVAFVFWTREPQSEFDPARFLDNPDPQEVAALLQSVERGRPSTRMDENAFYCLALSGNGGRAVVREWIETTVPEVRRNIARWFEDLRIVLAQNENEKKELVAAAGDIARPPGLYWLSLATARSADEVSPQTPVTLLRAAFKNLPPPLTILEQCLKRVRVGKEDSKKSSERKFTPARAALIRLIMNRNRQEGEPFMHEKLNLAETDPGYTCGRLLAVLERLQYLAQGSVGATIIDRFYGTASVAPQSVFPRLLRLAHNHLGKLKGDKPGAATNVEKDIESLSLRLDDFPPLLTLCQQGRFALGFYHQRAEYRKGSAERRAERETE